jgi:Peptidase family M23
LWLRDRRGTAYYYAHNQHNLVRLGQRVRAGQLLARVGATGNAKGGPPHLHPVPDPDRQPSHNLEAEEAVLGAILPPDGS